MKKHILYLSYDGLTDPLGESQILPYLFGLEKTGDYRFTIISFEKKGRFKDGKGRIQKQLEGVSIAWKPITYHASPPVLSTLYDLGKLQKAVKELHRTDPYAIVHCRSYLTALIGLKAKRSFGTKFLFDMRGFWADERVEGGIWNVYNPIFLFIYRWFKRKEKELLKEADHIVSLTHKAKDIINSWRLKENDLFISVIPCCVDMDHFNPAKIQPEDQFVLRKRLGIQADEFVLTYIGSLGTWYMLEEMLDFFQGLLLQKPRARFLIVTKDPVEIVSRILLTKKIDESKVIITSSDRENMPLHISLSDYSIFLIRPTFSKNASSPTKMGEIMAMGVPVITNEGIGDNDDILNSNIGITINSKVPKHIPDNDFDRSRIQQECRSRFSKTLGVRMYGQIYYSM